MASRVEMMPHFAMTRTRFSNHSVNMMPDTRRMIDEVRVGPYLDDMAVSRIKTTYSLDETSVRALERLAKRWDVSKSEALRRAIGMAASQKAEERDAIKTLNRLQRSVNGSKVDLQNWARRTRSTRRSSSAKREKTVE